MLLTILLILLILWLFGFAFDVAGGLIHFILVIAVVVWLLDFLSRRRRSGL